MKDDIGVTYGEMYKKLLADKRKGEEFFEKKNTLNVQVRSKGLELTIRTPVMEYFVLRFRDVNQKKAKHLPEQHAQIGSALIPFVQVKYNAITFFSENATKTLSDVFGHFKAEFKFGPINQFIFEAGASRRNVQFAASWYKTKRLSLNFLEINESDDDTEQFHEEDVKLILSTIKPTHAIEMRWVPPPGFSHEFESTCMMVNIMSGGHWISVKNLLYNGCQIFTVHESALTNIHMVEYLSKWIPRPFDSQTKIAHYEKRSIELQERANLAGIVALLPGAQELSWIVTADEEQRHIKFEDGRFVKLSVSRIYPNTVNMGLFPCVPVGYVRRYENNS